MKKTIIFFVICFISLQINAQIQPQVKKSTITNQQTINSSNQKILNQTTTKNPTPVYMITVNLWSNIQETDKDNNKTYMTILL